MGDDPAMKRLVQCKSGCNAKTGAMQKRGQCKNGGNRNMGTNKFVGSTQMSEQIGESMDSPSGFRPPVVMNPVNEARFPSTIDARRPDGHVHLKLPMFVIRRHISSKSVEYLSKAVPPKTPVPIPGKVKPSAAKAGIHLPPTDVSTMVYTPLDLNRRFQGDGYIAPSVAQIAHANAFFFRSAFKHEWTTAHYDEIPDIKVARQLEAKRSQMEKMEAYEKTDYHRELEKSKKTFGVKPQLLQPLPEVLLLGHTNAGKLTLVNNLFLDRNQLKTTNGSTNYAYVSRRAGYTKCLNCYNVGNVLRIVDSPGYGEFGEEGQGKVVLDYIRQRKQLRRTFVVVDSTAGVREEDAALMEFLVENGAPFEIVFTKVDDVVGKKMGRVDLKPPKGDSVARLAAFEAVKDGNSKVVAHFDQIIQRAGLADLATLPRLLFNNSVGSRLLPRRYGYREIRFSILESCGLASENAQVLEVKEEELKQANKGRRKRVIRRPR